MSWLGASGVAMWALVEHYTGHVRYKGGMKANGLNDDPPVIDCSGWVALLLSAGMNTANRATRRALFSDEEIRAIHTWSDRIIGSLEQRSGFILPGDQITINALPQYATIGLAQGGGAWATNHPRPRGITHIVQIVRRPFDGSPYVSEAQGMNEPFGLRLTPLAEWLDCTQGYLRPGKAWAVNAFSVKP